MRVVPVPTIKGASWEEAVDKLGKRDRAITLLPLSSLAVDGKDGVLKYDGRAFGMTRLAASQLASRLGVTPGYVLKIDNEIAATNFNHFLRAAQGSAQMIVENGNAVVGFLKERTVPVPVDQLVDRAAATLAKESFELAEWRYDASGVNFRLTLPKIAVQPRKGDIVRFGADITDRENTEDGLTTHAVAYRLVCTNGATAQEPVGLGKQMRREGWRDPSARIDLAFTAMRDTIGLLDEMREHLLQLPEEMLDWDDQYAHNVTVLHAGLAQIDGQPIRNNRLAQTVTETMADEEKSLYGLYNALTRIGRDSLDVSRRQLFEHAGFQLALRPTLPLQALREAAEVFSNN